MKMLKLLRDRVPELMVATLWVSLYVGTALVMVPS